MAHLGCIGDATVFISPHRSQGEDGPGAFPNTFSPPFILVLSTFRFMALPSSRYASQVGDASRIQNLRGRVCTCSNRYEHDVHACLLGRSDMSLMSAFALPPSTVSAATPTGLAHETKKKKSNIATTSLSGGAVERCTAPQRTWSITVIVGFMWYVRFECASFVP